MLAVEADCMGYRIRPLNLMGAEVKVPAEDADVDLVVLTLLPGRVVWFNVIQMLEATEGDLPQGPFFTDGLRWWLELRSSRQPEQRERLEVGDNGLIEWTYADGTPVARRLSVSYRSPWDQLVLGASVTVADIPVSLDKFTGALQGFEVPEALTQRPEFLALVAGL